MTFNEEKQVVQILCPVCRREGAHGMMHWALYHDLMDSVAPPPTKMPPREPQLELEMTTVTLPPYDGPTVASVQEQLRGLGQPCPRHPFDEKGLEDLLGSVFKWGAATERSWPTHLEMQHEKELAVRVVKQAILSLVRCDCPRTDPQDA